MTETRFPVDELERAVEGEVRFDDGTRAVYSRDSSNYRQVPVGVVLPRRKEDVVETVRVCREAGAAVLPRGGGTSLAGQCTNEAVVLDFSKYMDDVLKIDPEARRARVLPGTVLDDLRAAAAEHSLTFGPDPATHDHCCLGGMIGNNSCGPHSVMAGKTVDNVEELEVLTYDGSRFRVGSPDEEELRDIVDGGGRKGEIYGALRDLRDEYGNRVRERFPDIPRRVSGYNLDELLPENGFDVARSLVGTEGTCAVVLEATLRLVERPPQEALMVLGYPDVYRAADHVPEILEHDPVALEGIDEKLVDYMHREHLREENLQLLPEGNGWLLAEFPGESREEAKERARAAYEELRESGEPPSAAFFETEEEEQRIWEIRESGLGATARIPGQSDTWPGWEDSAVPPESLDEYLRDLRSLFRDYGYETAVYGHFGQGCVHCRIPFDLKTASGLEDFRSFLDEATDLVLSYGGSFSGEHGDGQARGEWLPKMFGEDLVGAFREFKRAWDPEWKMNPGKVVDADGTTEHLALGTDYAPWEPDTTFEFPEDDGSFARATTRCVGVGKCRRDEGGTMCPSYMVTEEEMHSTRGRARILFEMLNGDEIDRRGDEHVKEALDLCLACKGCKSDCPVSVDMATYKAEFLSQYYDGRIRPREAYSMGLIHWWARLASRFSGIVNRLAGAPLVSRAVKWLGGIAPEREVPEFASTTFRTWWDGHAPGSAGEGRRVLLFPDTFNNFFFPGTLRAGAEVLEGAGCQVELPSRILCCGRPLYDYGMLDLAKRQLRQILDVLRPRIREGVPLVGLEPSCVCTFRDELGELFPDDRDAMRLRQQTYTLAEFLEEELDGWSPPDLEGSALLWGHCQGRSVMGTEAEEGLLRKMGLEVDHPATGCCGMAGSFGFEQEHYDVSVAAGEHYLLPRVREADEDTWIVADGFSCRKQMSQLLDRRPAHLAELIREADEGD